MISWNATANGIVSEIPIVNGEGPLEELILPIAVRNSKDPILSARLMELMGAGLTRPLAPTNISDLLDGGRGIAILPLVPDVGVGIWRPWVLLRFAEAGADELTSPNSENISPRSAYLK